MDLKKEMTQELEKADNIIISHIYYLVYYYAWRNGTFKSKQLELKEIYYIILGAFVKIKYELVVLRAV